MQAFIDESRRALKYEYLPKIRSSVARLTDEDLWWRPNAASNSVGNLLLHLTGNLRQWVVSGVGGEEDRRDRQAEFDQDSGATAPELLQTLEATLAAVDEVLHRLDPERLSDPLTVQGRDVTVLRAISHAVNHFAMHTGQILYIAKLRVGSDLGFYDVVGGIARPKWEGREPQ